jgi:hypothetical protein
MRSLSNAKGNEKSKFRVVMGEGLSFEMNALQKARKSHSIFQSNKP